MLTFDTTAGFLLVHESQCLLKQSHEAAETLDPAISDRSD